MPRGTAISDRVPPDRENRWILRNHLHISQIFLNFKNICAERDVEALAMQRVGELELAGAHGQGPLVREGAGARWRCSAAPFLKVFSFLSVELLMDARRGNGDILNRGHLSSPRRLVSLPRQSQKIRHSSS